MRVEFGLLHGLRVLMRLFGPERDKVKETRGKLNNEASLGYSHTHTKNETNWACIVEKWIQSFEQKT
jgi:hypothetical protein